MRHYTFTDQLYYSDVENYTVDATEASQVLELHKASKTLFLRNDIGGDVFIAFDADVARTTDFRLRPADGLVPIKVQCKKLAMICAAGQTAAVRVSSNF